MDIIQMKSAHHKGQNGIFHGGTLIVDNESSIHGNIIWGQLKQ